MLVPLRFIALGHAEPGIPDSADLPSIMEWVISHPSERLTFTNLSTRKIVLSMHFWSH